MATCVPSFRATGSAVPLSAGAKPLRPTELPLGWTPDAPLADTPRADRGRRESGLHAETEVARLVDSSDRVRDADDPRAISAQQLEL